MGDLTAVYRAWMRPMPADGPAVEGQVTLRGFSKTTAQNARSAMCR